MFCRIDLHPVVFRVAQVDLPHSVGPVGHRIDLPRPIPVGDVPGFQEFDVAVQVFDRQAQMDALALGLLYLVFPDQVYLGIPADAELTEI